MNFIEFVKDRYFVYITEIMTAGVSALFLTAFKVPPELKAALGVIFIVMALLLEIWEFMRKRRFYRELFSKLDEVNEKYLISEMLTEPDFYEGGMVCDALHQAGRSMCELVEENRMTMSDFREFIEMWVHEIKVPLSSLLLMVRSENCGPDLKMLEQLHRIDCYTDKVLYYARSENAEKDYLINKVSLKRTVSDSVLKFKEELLLKDAAVQTGDLDAEVMTDGKWLGFIIDQFLSNSLKYFSPERTPVIEIFAEQFPDRTLLHFRDNGIGIPESDLPYVFEKSFTGENGRTGAKSTGMGLYIVKNLCCRLEHKISVFSQRGSYTEFVMTFSSNDHYMR